MTSCSNSFNEFSSRDKSREEEDHNWKCVTKSICRRYWSIRTSGQPSSESKYSDQSPCNEYWGRKTFLFWKISLIWNCLCSVVLKCLRRLLLWEVYKHHRPFKTSGFVSKYSRRERSSRRGSRILKWGVNFCNNGLEPMNIWGIRKKKKEGGSEKGGWKFTHFTSPGSAPVKIYQFVQCFTKAVGKSLHCFLSFIDLYYVFLERYFSLCYGFQITRQFGGLKYYKRCFLVLDRSRPHRGQTGYRFLSILSSFSWTQCQNVVGEFTASFIANS